MPVETSLSVRLTPRSRHNAIQGYADGVVRVRVTAAPVDGAANAALVAFLAEVMDIPKSRIRIAAGAASRNKRIVVEGIAFANVVDILNRHLANCSDRTTE